MKDGASDVHVEPSENCMRVRCRIDGRLHKTFEAPPQLLEPVTNRIKIMAGIDLAERRLPQDGRVHAMLEGRKIDFRVSTFPGSQGEKTVLRVLDAKIVSMNLENLGFADDVLTAFQANLRARNGILLVTGPTGSGKTTTLYAALNAVNSTESNVCTVEDPIECRLPWINQFQVQTNIGMTYAHALATLLRQDPDVIMVGELRDQDTAREAIQAALTGRLVFSALHSNDACSAITRLIHMGIEPYWIGAALNLVMSQRLVRCICSKCRATYEPARATRKALEHIGQTFPEFYKGMGCRACRNTGFKGRIGFQELLVVSDEMRDAIVFDPTVGNLRKMALQTGMISLAHDGFRKVREGITTVEEVFQILGNAGLGAGGCME
jgi:type IV pilus assembly protein PilB